MARRFFILNFWFLILCARRCHSRLAVLMLLRCLHQRMLRLERRRWCYENIFPFALAPFNKFLFFAIFKCSAALVFDLFLLLLLFRVVGIRAQRRRWVGMWNDKMRDFQHMSRFSSFNSMSEKGRKDTRWSYRMWKEPLCALKSWISSHSFWSFYPLASSLARSPL